MPGKKLALITYNDQGKYASSVENEDTILLNFLKEKGLDIQFEVWNDPEVNWKKYDLLILKSPWDYFDLIQDFYSWLDLLEYQKLKTLNPLPIIRWNTDKHYLQEIANAGFSITPSIWIEKGEAFRIEKIFRQFGSEKIIVKPCVSGGAKNTFAISRDDAEDHTIKLNALFAQETFLAQPFIPEIQTEGEWSFVYFNGKFSHSLIKLPQHGDFRVQHYLGGSILPSSPPPYLIKVATEIVQQFAPDCLYARVDGIEVNGTLMLMELELIEPFLFLFTNENALENYYLALEHKLKEI